MHFQKLLPSWHTMWGLRTFAKLAVGADHNLGNIARHSFVCCIHEDKYCHGVQNVILGALRSWCVKICHKWMLSKLLPKLAIAATLATSLRFFNSPFVIVPQFLFLGYTLRNARFGLSLKILAPETGHCSNSFYTSFDRKDFHCAWAHWSNNCDLYLRVYW